MTERRSSLTDDHMAALAAQFEPELAKEGQAGRRGANNRSEPPDQAGRRKKEMKE